MDCRRQLKPPGARAVAALALLAGASGLVACRRAPVSLAPAEGAREAVAVTLRTVGTMTLPRRVPSFGTLFAHEQVVIGAEVAGRIVAIGPEVADVANEKTVLARVSETNYVLLRDQRARALEESLARLGLKSVPEGAVDLESLPAVASARLEAENAAMRFERGRQLHARTPPLMSDQEIADLRTAADVAQGRLATARLEAASEAAAIFTRRSELEVAEEQVRKTVHRAPETGGPWVVAERHVAVGDYVAPGEDLYRLVDVDPLKLRVRIPERRMAGVAPGQTAWVTAAGRPGPVEGKVLRIRPLVDERTRTSEVEIEVPNGDFGLQAGGFAQAGIEIGQDQGVPVVPRASLVVFAGISKLIVEEKGLAGERVVVLGREVGEEVEILSGIAAGESYVADPPPGIVLGTPLLVSRQAPGGAR